MPYESYPPRFRRQILFLRSPNMQYCPDLSAHRSPREFRRETAADTSESQVMIRSFQSRDYQAARAIFAGSMGEMRGPLVRDVMHQAFLYGSSLLVPCCVFALFFSVWLLAVCFVTFSAAMVALFAGIHIGFSRYIQECLDNDLKNIESTYMRQKNSHLWVAEYNGLVIGMVALVPDVASRKDVGRLRRMAVVPEFRRLGVAKKLLCVLLDYAKVIGLTSVELLTTSAQDAAIKFYQKNGFQLVSKRLANKALRGFYHFIYSYDLVCGKG